MRTGLGERGSRRAGKYVANLGVGGSGGKRGIFLNRACVFLQLLADGILLMGETPECSYKKENPICIRCIDFLPDDAGSNFVMSKFFFFLKIHATSSLRVMMQSRSSIRCFCLVPSFLSNKAAI